MVGESNQNAFLIHKDTRTSQDSRYPSSRYRDSTVYEVQVIIVWIQTSEYCIAGNISGAKIWRNIKIFKSAGHKLAQLWYLDINGRCHEWHLPLVTPAFDTQIPKLRQFMTRRFKTLDITPNFDTANITHDTVKESQQKTSVIMLDSNNALVFLCSIASCINTLNCRL